MNSLLQKFIVLTIIFITFTCFESLMIKLATIEKEDLEKYKNENGLIPISGILKRYSYIGFLFFAIFFYPIALVVSLLIDDKNSYKSESDKADALLKYKQLLDEGVITQEEFERKKRIYVIFISGIT